MFAGKKLCNSNYKLVIAMEERGNRLLMFIKEPMMEAEHDLCISKSSFENLDRTKCYR